VARVGGKTAAVQALVSKVQLPVDLPPDIVLYAEGTLTIQGTGSQDAVGVDEGGGSATAYYDTSNYRLTGNPRGNPVNDDDTHTADIGGTSIESVFPTLSALITEADLAEREFANAGAFAAYSEQVGGATYSGWTLVNRTQPHIVVIDDGDISLPQMTIWSEAEPGLLIVRNGSVKIPGRTIFYGIIFCDGVDAEFDGGGTPEIHGAVITTGDVTLHGDRALNYNSKVMFNLDRMLIDSVRVVPGTWRELRGQELASG
jgi:hypothetical protein